MSWLFYYSCLSLVLLFLVLEAEKIFKIKKNIKILYLFIKLLNLTDKLKTAKEKIK